ncbi:MAG: hypothetical protein IAE80_28685 [Anaerolinea sp.]|nr:hypothetical protein [Anaerolinea sp.]
MPRGFMAHGNSSDYLPYMYLGSSWPILASWKQENPRAANQVVIGLLFIIFASSVTALITFN